MRRVTAFTTFFLAALLIPAMTWADHFQPKIGNRPRVNLKRLFNGLDANGDGELQLNEFLLMGKHNRKPCQRALCEQFRELAGNRGSIRYIDFLEHFANGKRTTAKAQIRKELEGTAKSALVSQTDGDIEFPAEDDIVDVADYDLQFSIFVLPGDDTEREYTYRYEIRTSAPTDSQGGTTQPPGTTEISNGSGPYLTADVSVSASDISLKYDTLDETKRWLMVWEGHREAMTSGPYTWNYDTVYYFAHEVPETP